MSAQLLICKFAVFTLFLPMVHVTCMARSSSSPTHIIDIPDLAVCAGCLSHEPSLVALAPASLL